MRLVWASVFAMPEVPSYADWLIATEAIKLNDGSRQHRDPAECR
jgi:hypothetical protein